MNRLALIVLLTAILTPRVSAAQSAIGALGYVTYGQMSLAASNSFETIGGKSKETRLGGGGTVTRLWKGLFVDVGVSQQRVTGERVFINNGTVFSLGIPVSITIRPIDLVTGWRVIRGRVTPYAGGGMSFVSYQERDDFANAGEVVDERATGGVLLGGVDIAILRWVHVGAEVRHRFVSGILGEGGVSEAKGDNQLGGTALAVRMGIGR